LPLLIVAGIHSYWHDRKAGNVCHPTPYGSMFLQAVVAEGLEVTVGLRSIFGVAHRHRHGSWKRKKYSLQPTPDLKGLREEAEGSKETVRLHRVAVVRDCCSEAEGKPGTAWALAARATSVIRADIAVSKKLGRVAELALLLRDGHAD
jgi:hypothetical protein